MSIQRLSCKIKIDEITKCWNWQSAKDKDGYGRFWLKDKTMPAHRASYELFIGEITEGLQIDHLCKNTSCVNPEHLELVTLKENVLRGIGISAQNARKTHCNQGHEFNPKNTYVNNKGNRSCRECHRLLEKMRRGK